MNVWPIAPVSLTDPGFGIVEYGFLDLTGNELADLPSIEGSIDLLLADFNTSLADQVGLVASMADDLNDVFSVANEIGGDDLESLFGNLSSAASAGDAILSSYQGLLGDNAGSGGGGGTGGTGGTCDQLAFGSIPVSVAGAENTVTSIWNARNTSGTDLHVKGPTTNPPAGTVFMTNPNPSGATIPAGGSLAVTILFTPGAAGTYNTTLTLLTDGPDPQPCVNLTGTGTGPNLLGGPPAGNPPPSTPPGTGGGGTGGPGPGPTPTL